jgi:tripartite-type tricarboxylate transporter receptor subunit TctC
VTRQTLKVIAGLVLTVALAALPLLNSAASAQADFYKGKTIRIMVGSTPGSFYDLWGRAIGANKFPVIPR